MATERREIDPLQAIIGGALDEVLASIEDGSAFPLTEDALEALRQRYQPDFEDNLRANVDWQKARTRVLPLARVVGSLASTLMVIKLDGENVPLPTFVDADSALLASDLVAEMSFCPPEEEKRSHPFGKFCSLRAEAKQGPAADALFRFFNERLAR
jgi:hypothetical protein